MERQSKLRSPSKKKFLVKEDDGLYTVFADFFDSVENRTEAMVIALRLMGEIHDTLREEAIGGESLFVGNMKVTTGLTRSLDELDRRWPFLLIEMQSVKRKINGKTLEIC